MRFTLRAGAAALAVVLAAGCSDTPTGPDAIQTASTAFVTVSVGETTSATLLAGQNIPVGTVYVEHLGGNQVEITYQLNAGYCLDEVHWAAVTSVSSLTNKGGNPQIGKFPYGDDDLGCVSSYTEVGSIMGTGDTYYVAAHAVVVGAGAGDNPHVVYGIVDVDGDGGDEGDIYGINPVTGDITLVADLANTAGNFYPNGLALEHSSEMLYYVTNSSNLYRIPTDNADPNTVTPELVSSSVGGGEIFSATIDGGYYYFMPNGVQQLWRVSLAAPASGAMYCDLSAALPGDALFFGDIAAEPGNGTIYGIARVDNGTSGNVIYFTIDLATCNTTWVDPTTYNFQLQIAFGPDGTMYGQQAISEPVGNDPGQWYVLNPATGEITSMVAQTARSFTDIADGLPFEPFEFDETAWAQGTGFRGGSWAMYMGPFTIDD